MIRYIIQSIQRKIARRVTKKYPSKVDVFEIKGLGKIKFANWENPLVEKKIVRSEAIAFFGQFLSEGDLALDIGANIGIMSVQMSLNTGRTGLTIGFDPNPFVFEILKKNSLMNPEFGCLKVHNLAITDKEETFYYHSSEASFNNGGISSEPDQKHGKFSLSHKIQGVHLHSFLQNYYPEMISRLKLVKIDTEGYDKEIIKSISDLLKMYKPVVITECFGKNTREEKFEQFDIMDALGYSLFYFSDFDIHAEIIPITCKEDMLKWKHFDLYAIPDKE